ncbi:MAG: rod shape-determining protein MreC [Oscillospiraceae bacterium]|nr:rod shape-determining protein MreC [Oscillospiraceae bacterium]
MTGRRSAFRGLWTLTAAAVLALLLWGASLTGWLDPVRDVAGRGALLLQQEVQTVARYCRSPGRDGRADAELSLLRWETARYRLLLRDASATARENDRLRALLDFRDTRPALVLSPVAVLSVDGDPWRRALLLSAREPLAEKACVVTADGALAGILWETGDCWALARAVTDPRLALGGAGLRTDALCLVEGDPDLSREGLLKATGFSEGALLPGDRVVTAGSSGLYPAGLTVGTVREVSLDAAGLTYTAVIEPAAVPGRSAHLYVVTGFERTAE